MAEKAAIENYDKSEKKMIKFAGRKKREKSVFYKATDFSDILMLNMNEVKRSQWIINDIGDDGTHVMTRLASDKPEEIDTLVFRGENTRERFGEELYIGLVIDGERLAELLSLLVDHHRFDINVEETMPHMNYYSITIR